MADGARQIDQPRPGFFCRRLVRGGWTVPGRICFENGLWYAIINGQEFPGHEDPVEAHGVMWLWQGAIEIDEANYRWLEDTRTYYEKTDPKHPAANARTRINRARLSPI